MQANCNLASPILIYSQLGICTDFSIVVVECVGLEPLPRTPRPVCIPLHLTLEIKLYKNNYPIFIAPKSIKDWCLLLVILGDITNFTLAGEQRFEL